MPDLLAFLEENKDLSDITKRNYREKVRTLERKTEKPILDIVQAPKTYAPMIQKWYPLHTSQNGYFIAVLALFRYNPTFKQSHEDAYKRWIDAFQVAKGKVTAQYEANEPTERQKEGYVPYEDILKARDDLPVGDMKRLLLGFYTHIRPRRAEYTRVALYKSTLPKPHERNYILLQGKKAKLVLQDFKTSKHHDALETWLPEPLCTDLYASLKQQPRDWLFVNRKGEPYTQPLYSQWTARVFQQLFHKPLTLQLIRHAFINTLDMNTLTFAEKKKIAQEMAHDVTTQDQYRLIFKDKNQNCNCVCTPEAKP